VARASSLAATSSALFDSRGRVGTASLTWNVPSATLALDASFAAVASYPVTISLTVEYIQMYCYTGFGG
jgi:hypothetical protein